MLLHIQQSFIQVPFQPRTRKNCSCYGPSLCYGDMLTEQKARLQHCAGYLPLASLKGLCPGTWICLYPVPPASYWVCNGKPRLEFRERDRVRQSLEGLHFLPAKLLRACGAAITKVHVQPSSLLCLTPELLVLLPSSLGSTMTRDIAPSTMLPLNSLLHKSCSCERTFIHYHLLSVVPVGTLFVCR